MSASHHTPIGEGSNRIEWWCLFVLALVAFVLGTIGFYQYDSDPANNVSHASLGAAMYHSVQLFALHGPHLHGATPAAMETGRWMAVVVFFWALARLTLRLMRKDWSALTLLWRNDHLVICGLGKLGLRLALEAKQRGWKPVAIEKNPEPGTERGGPQWNSARRGRRLPPATTVIAFALEA